MIVTTTPTCEALFLHVYTNDNNEFQRIAKRLRLTPMKQPHVDGQTFCERICFKMHDNVTIYVYDERDYTPLRIRRVQ